MVRYIGKRLFHALLTLFIIATITFMLMNLMPGQPFTGEKPIPEEIRKNMEIKYGLDKPIFERYIIYLKNLAKGDLGMSMVHKHRSVGSIIKQSFPISASLGLRALTFAVIAGLFLGIVASVNHDRAWDHISMVIAVIGVSVPSFIIGGLLQYFVGVKLRWFPVTDWDSFRHTIMPSFSLGLGTLAVMARMMRTSMLDVLSQDYIKTAKGKGLSKTKVVWRHGIRNAILPVVTIMGPLVAAITTGTFVVENIFAIPGLGQFMVSSVSQNDYTLIMGLTLFYSLILVVMNLIVDLLYGIVDPRIVLTEGKE